MKKEDLLEQLQDALINNLLAKIKAGEASSADLAVARQLLKDNSVVINPAKEDGVMFELAEELPFEQPDELTKY